MNLSFVILNDAGTSSRLFTIIDVALDRRWSVIAYPFPPLSMWFCVARSSNSTKLVI